MNTRLHDHSTMHQHRKTDNMEQSAGGVLNEGIFKARYENESNRRACDLPKSA